MEMKQMSQGIPVYNDMLALERTIDRLENLKKQNISKIIIESTPGIEIPGSNFTQAQLLSIIDLILSCKKSKMTALKKQLDAI